MPRHIETIERTISTDGSGAGTADTLNPKGYIQTIALEGSTGGSGVTSGSLALVDSNGIDWLGGAGASLSIPAAGFLIPAGELGGILCNETLTPTLSGATVSQSILIKVVCDRDQLQSEASN